MGDAFETIFARARALDLRLNNFFQVSDGRFRANWRRDFCVSAAGAVANCAEFAESTDPFHALKDALAIAERTLPAPAPADQDDLFGGIS